MVIIMEHSKHYEKIKNWYSLRMWNEARVRNAVEAEWITEAEFEEITGNDYDSRAAEPV